MVVQPGFLIPLLGGEAVGDVLGGRSVPVVAYFPPHLPVGGVLDPLIGIPPAVAHHAHAAQVVGVVVVGGEVFGLPGAPCIRVQSGHRPVGAHEDVLGVTVDRPVFPGGEPGVEVEGFPPLPDLPGAFACGIVEKSGDRGAAFDFLEAVLAVPGEIPPIAAARLLLLVVVSPGLFYDAHIPLPGHLRGCARTGGTDGGFGFHGEVPVRIVGVIVPPDPGGLMGFVRVLIAVFQAVVQGASVTAQGHSGVPGGFRGFIELELTTDERRWGPMNYFRAVD